MKNKELGIYIHIPFCKSKCYYCDFISYTDCSNQVECYIQKVLEELKEYELSTYHVTTIYIGGGTPSFVKEKQIELLLKTLQAKLSQNPTAWKDIEITIEVNPGTITRKKLEVYRKAGINRISIGLQSTQNRLLKEIGRIHTYEQFLDTYQLVKELEFENVNVDLMIGLPNQTIQDLKETLAEVEKLEPNHISVYSLIIEEGTKMEQWICEGKLQLPDEEVERQMYWYVKNTLELKGYKHYEISNFAKPGKESKHNLNCWEQKEYIGLGASAHSYIQRVRYSNASFNELKEWDFKNKTIEEKQNSQDQRKEYMLLGLRKIEGISIQKFKQKFKENPIYLYRMELEKLITQDLLVIDGDWIRLTNKGIDFANLVWEEFV